MSAFDERREQDIAKLRNLQKRSGDRVRITRVAGRPLKEIDIELRVKTAPSEQYPHAIQEVTLLSIALPARYPFNEPTATIKTPILHPNVYSSGRICFGVKWIPSFGLDLLVKRIVQIVSFDPGILNEASPANGQALLWYRKTRLSHPDAFPTDSLSWPVLEQPKTMTWNELSPKVLVSCGKCGARLSLPKGKRGRVKCPKCNAVFEAVT